MRRLVTGSLISLVAITQLAATSLAQDASPSPVATAVSAAAADPMPYADYVAALEAFTTNDPFAGVSDTPTTDELVAAFETLVAKATVEQERLDAVVPEDCYAEAHAELLMYWASSTELTGQLATGLAAGGSLDALGPSWTTWTPSSSPATRSPSWKPPTAPAASGGRPSTS